MRFSISDAIKYYEENIPRGEYVLVVEGAADTEDAPRDIDIYEEFNRLKKGGMREMDAMKQIALVCGVSKREIYAQIKGKKGEDKNE